MKTLILAITTVLALNLTLHAEAPDSYQVTSQIVEQTDEGRNSPAGLTPRSRAN